MRRFDGFRAQCRGERRAPSGARREVCAIGHVDALAHDCGIDMPPTRHIVPDARTSAFGVQRVDRVGDVRVPVQTFAAALGADVRLPALDWRNVLHATRCFTGDEQAVRQACARCVFDNRDDHASHIALRMDDTLRWSWPRPTTCR